MTACQTSVFRQRCYRKKLKKVLFADDSTMMFIIFDTTTSADETMDAIGDIRKLAGKQCFVSGMSAIVTDTKIWQSQRLRFTY